MWDDIALGLAGAWLLSAIAVGGIATYLITRTVRENKRGQGAPRWTPDPAFDPALIEDDEVAQLDALWDLPATDPRQTW